jgi:hypothetical protein
MSDSRIKISYEQTHHMVSTRAVDAGEQCEHPPLLAWDNLLGHRYTAWPCVAYSHVVALLYDREDCIDTPLDNLLDRRHTTWPCIYVAQIHVSCFQVYRYSFKTNCYMIPIHITNHHQWKVWMDWTSVRRGLPGGRGRSIMKSVQRCVLQIKMLEWRTYMIK